MAANAFWRTSKTLGKCAFAWRLRESREDIDFLKGTCILRSWVLWGQMAVLFLVFEEPPDWFPCIAIILCLRGSFE